MRSLSGENPTWTCSESILIVICSAHPSDSPQLKYMTVNATTEAVGLVGWWVAGAGGLRGLVGCGGWWAAGAGGHGLRGLVGCGAGELWGWWAVGLVGCGDW